MLREIDMIDIKILYKQGYSLKNICRETGFSINTVRKYITKNAVPSYKKREKTTSKLDNYKSYINVRVNQAKPNWIPATVIFDEIKKQGYLGKISLLRNYMYNIKPKVVERPLIRFETQPGEQMQVDFATFRQQNKKYYAFVAILGYSRLTFVKFVEDQKIDTFIKCHEEAFEYFGGITKSILYDNMKTVIIKRNFYGKDQHQINSNFRDFAKHHGFRVKLCKPYSPQTKGKVERVISYLRHSFYNPLISTMLHTLALDNLNIEVINWLNNVANNRIHGTTNTSPQSRWLVEQKYLLRAPQSYVSNYGEKAPTTTLVGIMPNVDACLQHNLSVYDSLLAGAR